MNVPTEVLLSICQLLEQPDLKSLRLVSKSTCAIASTFVFRQIYVSSAKEDLEIFEAVARDPLLSGCVRHLKYDATEFLEGPTKEQYIAELWTQAPSEFQSRRVKPPGGSKQLENRGWEKEGVLGRFGLQIVTKKIKNSQTINRGYKAYKAQACYQQGILRSGQFIEKMVDGLKLLTNLKAVTLEGDWEYLGMLHQSSRAERLVGSYLARHWNPIWCKPQGWRWALPDNDNDFSDYRSRNWDEKLESWKNCPDGVQSFRIITSAIARAQRQITSFTVGIQNGYYSPGSPGLPPTLFNPTECIARQSLACPAMDLDAFAQLEKFVLPCLASYNRGHPDMDSTVDLFDNIAGLPLLLKALRGLNHLELCLTEDYSSHHYYEFHQVVPSGTTWPSLKYLKLYFLSATAQDLLNFILCRTPNLSHLEIGYIDLLEGSWEAFFEGLSQSKQLRCLEFEWKMCCETFLFYGDGIQFLEDDGEPDADFSMLEIYVVDGGRHPCLDETQPDSAARAWLNEFDEALQHQIIKLGNTNTRPAAEFNHPRG